MTRMRSPNSHALAVTQSDAVAFAKPQRFTFANAFFSRAAGQYLHPLERRDG